MGNGTEENPFTREDVLRLIKENGGNAEGLDLSGKYFEDGIDLHGLDLKGINLIEANLESANLIDAQLKGAKLVGTNLTGVQLLGAQLEGADLSEANLRGTNLMNTNLKKADLWFAILEGADLSKANLEGIDATKTDLRKADLEGACLEGANLLEANLEGARLMWANFKRADLESANLKGVDFWRANLEGVNLDFTFLEEARLSSAKFSYDTKLDNVRWIKYVLTDERTGDLKFVIDTYRRLKIWYTEHGMYDIAGKFFYREMEAKRKARSWKTEPHLKLWSWLMRLLCGYGENYERVVVSALVIIFGLAVVYVYGGLNLAYAIYFSAVSFTALGYGSWADTPIGWVQGVGATESFLGVFMMALFLITFFRKMTR